MFFDVLFTYKDERRTSTNLPLLVDFVPKNFWAHGFILNVVTHLSGYLKSHIQKGRRNPLHYNSQNITPNKRILLKLDGKPHKLKIIQLYASKTTADETRIEELYTKLENTIQSIPRKELTVICDDFNVKVGNTVGFEYREGKYIILWYWFSL